MLVIVTSIVAWNSLAGVVFELGEQERFRAATDPILLAAAAWIAWERFRPVSCRDAVADNETTS